MACRVAQQAAEHVIDALVGQFPGKFDTVTWLRVVQIEVTGPGVPVDLKLGADPESFLEFTQQGQHIEQRVC